MRTNSQMHTCENGLVEIIGLCVPSNVTEVINIFPYWKQMHISETLQIPDVKPDIEQINSVDISVDIFRSQVVKTPRSYNDAGTTPVEEPSLEGKLLTGRKLIIEGQLCQKIVYTALKEEQSVHSAHFYVPFSSYIVVPKTISFSNANGTTVIEDSYNVNFEVNSCVEDVTTCVLGTRNILKQITLMLYAVPTQSC